MAKAKQLPSGQWRTLVYSHTENIDGKKKRIYESFTADTRKESEFAAAKFALDKKAATKANMTVEKAINTYIDTKSNILSPSTIRAYKLNAKNHLEGIKQIPVDKLTSVMVQSELNALSGKKLSPKTIRNIYGMLTAALKEAKPELQLKCVLPQKKKTEITVPTADELDKLIKATDGDLQLAIKLSAYMGLRRSELCALTWDDIDLKNRKLKINKGKVMDSKGKYIVKGTKTTNSTRTLDIPLVVLKDLEAIEDKTGDLLSLVPNHMHKPFKKAIQQAGINDFRFHDLRHYYASVMLSLGVPDKYAMERMGHSTSNMLKTVYQHTFEEKQAEITNKLDEYFNPKKEPIQHKMQHKTSQTT